MGDAYASTRSSSRTIAGLATRVIAVLERIPYWLIALAARVFPAAVFWQSGRTKVEGWKITDNVHRGPSGGHG
jgi:putative oxidoreductase